MLWVAQGCEPEQGVDGGQPSVSGAGAVVSLVFEMIGDHARARGDNGRAAEAYEDALELWQSLGRADRVASVKKALGRIGTVPHLKRRKAPAKLAAPKERTRAKE